MPTWTHRKRARSSDRSLRLAWALHAHAQFPMAMESQAEDSWLTAVLRLSSSVMAVSLHRPRYLFRNATPVSD